MDCLQRQLESIARSSNPDLHIALRRPIPPGLSGAALWLVDCDFGSIPRLGVLKVTERDKAEREVRGHAAAAGSWLSALLPDEFRSLGEVSGTGKVAVLSALARNRLEDCRTLRDVVNESIAYGTSLIKALAFAYRTEANRVWTPAGRLSNARECFAVPVGEASAAEILEPLDGRWPPWKQTPDHHF